MTKRRYDDHSTEFGLWLREQPDIDSQLGFIATNLDYIWKNYRSGFWMMIEEKRHMAVCRKWQRDLFSEVHQSIKKDPKYKGFHFIQFENKGPDDGKIFINYHDVTPDQLIKFLQFDKKTLNFVWRKL